MNADKQVALPDELMEKAEVYSAEELVNLLEEEIQQVDSDETN